MLHGLDHLLDGHGSLFIGHAGQLLFKTHLRASERNLYRHFRRLTLELVTGRIRDGQDREHSLPLPWCPVGAKMADTSCSAFGMSAWDSLRTLDERRQVKMEKRKFHL